MRAQLIAPGTSKLSVRKQCELLAVNRSKVYYEPVAEKPENIAMMNIMDKHLHEHPTEGVKSMVFLLASMGFFVGPKPIRRLFRIMGQQTLYRRKNLTKAGQREYIRPYLLRGLKITHVNQVWCTGITYIPMKMGFMYLTAFIDVYSRRIVSIKFGNRYIYFSNANFNADPDATIAITQPDFSTDSSVLSRYGIESVELNNLKSPINIVVTFWHT